VEKVLAKNSLNQVAPLNDLEVDFLPVWVVRCFPVLGLDDLQPSGSHGEGQPRFFQGSEAPKTHIGSGILLKGDDGNGPLEFAVDVVEHSAYPVEIVV
jgi:hypothetical protein